ncbi:hypothetical protein SynROS8604_01065 [Synechococcus sp. ROS8604]|nr:hypothetical protein SynROS8604_01065 [Synechococcus sp. ROS8604]
MRRRGDTCGLLSRIDILTTFKGHDSAPFSFDRVRLSPAEGRFP